MSATLDPHAQPEHTPNGGIDSALGRQVDVVCALDKIIQDLWERLERVLRDERTVDAEIVGPDYDGLSPVASTIESLTERIRAQVRSVERLRDRLDL